MLLSFLFILNHTINIKIIIYNFGSILTKSFIFLSQLGRLEKKNITPSTTFSSTSEEEERRIKKIQNINLSCVELRKEMTLSKC